MRVSDPRDSAARGSFRDLEDWFAVHRRYADFTGCTVSVVDGQLVLLCDGEVQVIEWTSGVPR